MYVLSTPFDFPYDDAPSDVQFELIELQASDVLLSEFISCIALIDFYRQLPHAQFPMLLGRAKRVIAMFGSTYSGEQLFSKMKFFVLEFGHDSSTGSQATIRAGQLSDAGVADLVGEPVFACHSKTWPPLIPPVFACQAFSNQPSEWVADGCVVLIKPVLALTTYATEDILGGGLDCVSPLAPSVLAGGFLIGDWNVRYPMSQLVAGGLLRGCR
ncbi:unnamed protein product [Schistocephalus solidus]|uniref:Dimer_Tnp_hAT domain-containing protein n=1 Tax=Schistocephalus solidus TaxID=70667 RepID=A0A183SZP6_SCHSO|nr:unnamed protein product [Schistocephalus solidus]